MKTITQNLLSCVKNYAMQLTLLVTLLSFQTQALASQTNSKLNVPVETNRVWINVTDSHGAFSQTLMGYRAGATDGCDSGLDGAYMNNGAIALASLIGSVRYAIQFKGLPFSDTDVVPLSFSASYNGTYTFVIDHMDGFFTNNDFAVYIHDTVTNTYNNLKMGSYTFNADAGMYNNRFELAYITISSYLGTNQNTFTTKNLNVSQNNTDIVINSGTTLLKEISLYSINGNLLYQNRDTNSNQTTISSHIQNQQPIIIKVITQDGITVAKKWLYL